MHDKTSITATAEKFFVNVSKGNFTPDDISRQPSQYSYRARQNNEQNSQA